MKVTNSRNYFTLPYSFLFFIYTLNLLNDLRNYYFIFSKKKPYKMTITSKCRDLEWKEVGLVLIPHTDIDKSKALVITWD